MLDKLRMIAEGPALDLPAVEWEPPGDLDVLDRRTFAQWGEYATRVDLEPEFRRIWLAGLILTYAEAEELARRLLCAVALGREVQS